MSIQELEELLHYVVLIVMWFYKHLDYQWVTGICLMRNDILFQEITDIKHSLFPDLQIL